MENNENEEITFSFTRKLVDTILTSYKWIKVSKYDTKFEDLKADPNTNWKLEYEMLMEHHEKETNFLIGFIRNLFKKENEK